MKTILIIENDADALFLIEFLLIDRGYRTLTSLTTLAVESIKYLAPDMILLDQWLGSESGNDLCLQLKADPLAAHIPVIFVSAANNIENIAQSSKANGCIAKPFDVNTLTNLVNGFLQ